MGNASMILSWFGCRGQKLSALGQKLSALECPQFHESQIDHVHFLPQLLYQ